MKGRRRMQAKITKRMVDSATPGRIYDTELKGFCLVVTPAGSKSYAVEYRAGRGRAAPNRRLTIGKHGSPWTPEAARRRAKELLAEVARGGDPARDRKAEREALTFAELIDLYFAEGVSLKKPKTVRTDRGRAEHWLRPILGRLRVDQVGRAEIERMRDAVAVGKGVTKPEKRSGSVIMGGKGVAAQCVALASAIFTFADKRGICKLNPARGVAKEPVQKLERFLAFDEISRLADALEAEAAKSGNPIPTAAIKLLMLTGCRKGEIVGLHWSHVDFERRLLRLPQAKETKGEGKIVHLSPPALALLESLPHLAGNPYVIPGRRAVSGSAAIDRTWARVRRGAGIPDVRLHDLRHSYASIAAAGGASLLMIGRLLGHRNTVTTERYAHLSADPLRAVNDRVGERISAAMRKRIS
jgi:integrase